MTTLNLYHGTSVENFASIKKDGVIKAPVFLATSKEVAEDYASSNSADFVVIEVCVNIDDLQSDVDHANSWSVLDSIEAGSVRVDSDVAVAAANVTLYEDYSEVR